MFIARIVCSDRECTEELEVTIEDLDELENYLCDCGHGFVLLTVSELREEGGGQLLELPRRRSGGTARRAA